MISKLGVFLNLHLENKVEREDVCYVNYCLKIFVIFANNGFSTESVLCKMETSPSPSSMRLEVISPSNDI